MQMGMARDDIEARVIEIVAEQAVLEPGDVSMDQSLEDLGIDSLGLVEAIFAIEESFDISVPFNANVTLNGIDDVLSPSSSVVPTGAAIGAFRRPIDSLCGENRIVCSPIERSGVAAIARASLTDMTR